MYYRRETTSMPHPIDGTATLKDWIVLLAIHGLPQTA